MRICLIQIMDTINLTTSVSCIYPPCSGDSLTSTTWPETHLREKNEKKTLVFLRKIFTPGWVTTASLSNAYSLVDSLVAYYCKVPVCLLYNTHELS